MKEMDKKQTCSFFYDVQSWLLQMYLIGYGVIIRTKKLFQILTF